MNVPEGQRLYAQGTMKDAHPVMKLVDGADLLVVTVDQKKRKTNDAAGTNQPSRNQNKTKKHQLASIDSVLLGLTYQPTATPVKEASKEADNEAYCRNGLDQLTATQDKAYCQG